MSSARNNKSLVGKAALVLALVAVIAGCALIFSRRSQKPPIEVERTALVSKEGKLYLKDSNTPFSGVMLEHYPSGQIQSRSVIVSGVLDGLSQGFYTNGQTQVEERFKAGVSDGTRIKWYPGGAKLSETSIRNGKLAGTFRRWHENGKIAEEVQMEDGVPNGKSFSYYPSGCLKAEATHEHGKLLNQHYFKDGEEPRSPQSVSSADRPPSSG